MLNKNKKIILALTLLATLLFTACDTPTLGKKVEKEYYTGGQLREEFIWSDSVGQYGIKKTYGYDGELTSTVNIANGVPHGIMTIYDSKRRVIRQIPYVNGKVDGVDTSFYPNGDKMITYTYRDGMKHGDAYSYYPDGRVCRKAIYRKNRLSN